VAIKYHHENQTKVTTKIEIEAKTEKAGATGDRADSQAVLPHQG
jgi:hypothetical protein